MIVLVPVSRFRVAYEIARGRPYSRLERRVLEAIAGGGATLRALTTAFQVHERLLIESVVTLVKAGWVAVAGGAEATFVLTAEGQAAIDTGQDPVSVVVSQAKPQIVILERVTGQLARHSDARSYRREDLTDVWESAAFVKRRIYRNTLDEAMVQKLLPRGPGEWIRWVGPITLTSKNVHFVPADVSDETSQVRGLPPAWLGTLNAQIVEAAHRRRALDAEDAARPPKHKTAEVPLHASTGMRRTTFVSVADTTVRRSPLQAHAALRAEDVLVGTDAHSRALAEALDSAAGSLLIASPSTDPDRLAAFLADASDAVRRHVRIDILPGSTPEAFQQPAVLDAVNRAGYQSVGNEGRSLLRSGRQATGSGASLLLYDGGPGRLVVVVGNHDWLGAPAADVPVSVRLDDPGVTAPVARAAAALWQSAQPGGLDTGAADRWRHLASATEERAAMESSSTRWPGSAGTTGIELLIDDEHLIPPPQREDVVRVGRFIGDNGSEHDSLRGLSVQLTGTGADLVTQLTAN
jgi:hypothetical protein